MKTTKRIGTPELAGNAKEPFLSFLQQNDLVETTGPQSGRRELYCSTKEPGNIKETHF